MPSSTLNRPRTRAKPSDWVVLVPGQQPIDRPEMAALAEPTPAATSPRLRPGGIARIPRASLLTAQLAPFRSAISRFLPMVCLVAVAVATLGLVTGPDPLLALGLKTPRFVAYQGASADNVRFVMNDGWGLAAAAPGALVMDWHEGAAAPAMRLTLGNPAAEPEVERLAADGDAIKEIRYRSAWPGIDAVVGAIPGGWACNFVVQPGVDPATIELEYVGATELTIDQAGRLRVRGSDGVWIDGTPESWQDGPAGREPVESHYELRGGNRFGFSIGSYDPSRPLVVDPPSERSN